MNAPISGRQDGSNYFYSVGPDTCDTPMGSCMVPVPYNSIAFLSSSERLSRNVRNNDNPDFQLNSRASVTTGHEPGTGRGVIVPGYKKYSFAQMGAGTVFSSGWTVVRDGDPAWMNRPDPGPEEEKRKSSRQTISYA